MTPTPQSMLPECASPGSSHSRCNVCGTDTHLFIESVDVSRMMPGQSLEISYTCVGCAGYHAHDVDTGSLSPRILRVLTPQTADAMDGSYLHCREPMTIGVTAERTILTTLSSRPGKESELELYMRTRVLHCRCGFQIEAAPRREA